MKLSEEVISIILLATASAFATQTLQVDTDIQITSSNVMVAELSPTRISLMNDSLVVTIDALELSHGLKISTRGSSYMFWAGNGFTSAQSIPNATLVSLNGSFFSIDNMNLIADSPSCTDYCGTALFNTGFNTFTNGVLLINLTGPAQSFPNLRIFPYSACLGGQWALSGAGTGLMIQYIQVCVWNGTLNGCNWTSDAQTSTWKFSIQNFVAFQLCSIIMLDKQQSMQVAIRAAVYHETGTTQSVSIIAVQSYENGEGLKVVPLFM